MGVVGRDPTPRREAQRTRRRFLVALAYQPRLRPYLSAVRVRLGARPIVSIRTGATSRPRGRVLARFRALAIRATSYTPWPGGRAHLSDALARFYGRTIRRARLTLLVPLRWLTPDERRILAGAAGCGGRLEPAGIAAIMNANLRETVIRYVYCERHGGPAAWMHEYRAVIRDLADFGILSEADLRVGDAAYASGRFHERAPITGVKVRRLSLG